MRRIWPDEARDFTPWLARPENLAHLGNALGLGELQLEALEQPIGDFYLDVLARDPLGHRVVIENQLDVSDHGHPGQLITYAAGTTDGLTIIWVSSKFRPEHAAAIEWLNAMTPENVQFHAVEITAWQVTPDGPPGYQFRVKVQPEQIGRKAAGSETPLTKEQTEYREYWTAFVASLKARKAQHWIRPDLPRSTWYGRNVGRAGFNFYGVIKPKERSLAVMLEVSGTDHEAHFAALGADRVAIEQQLGSAPQWSSTGARDYVTTEHSGFDFRNRIAWPEQHAWLFEQLERYRTTFTPRILALPASKGAPEAPPADA
ncbi:MAG: DUF4268 domain-containing protein [Proteobacteria bacterium]|nr:DUF4268 domain-containing protein [Pseudomonadota bacterium]